MEKSKTIEILRSLDPGEIKRFKDFLASPFFNTSNNIISLFEALRKYYPDFKPANIKKEKIYRKVFGDKEYNEQVMKNLISEFLRLQRDFLAYTDFETIQFDREISTLRKYERKKLDRLFLTGLKNLKQKVSAKANIDYDYFRKLSIITELEIIFYLNRNRQDAVPQKVLEQGELVISDFINKVSHTIQNMIINEDTLNARFEFNIPYRFWKNAGLDSLVDYMKDGNPLHYIMTAISYLSVIAYESIDDDEPYYKLKELIIDNYHQYNHPGQVELFWILEQVCLRKAIHGRKDLNRELFDIYKLTLEKNVYKAKDAPFPASKYRNICIIAMNNEEFDWAEEFLNKYRSQAGKKAGENIYNLLSAQINFHKGNYEKALGFLSKVKDENFSAKHDTKQLLLKLYYELGYLESGFSLIDSMRHFISKSKQMKDERKTQLKNYVNMMNALFKLKANYSDEGLNKFKCSLKDFNSVNTLNYDYIVNQAAKLEEKN